MKKIEIVYKILINGLAITDSTLMKYGLNQSDINELIGKGQIKRNDDDTYSLVMIGDFYNYGQNLLFEKNIMSANACFYKCYELAPDVEKFCLRILIIELKKQEQKNYEKIFRIISELEKKSSEIRKYTNLYLYLLGYIVEEPISYITKVNELSYSKLMLDASKEHEEENEVRRLLLNSKYKYAMTLLNDIINKRGQTNRYKLIKILINRVIESEKIFKDKILELALNEQYEEILSILYKRQQIRPLNKLETNIFLIVDAIEKILRTKIIPEANMSITYNLYKALIGNNFKLALEINNDYLEGAGMNKNADIVNVLLTKLNNIIFEIEQANNKQNDYSNDNKLLSKGNDSLTKNVLEAQNIAYYINSINLKLEQAKKRYGLSLELVLLIKLVYARDYYIESKFVEGDKLLAEVEFVEDKSSVVIAFLEEIKLNKVAYKNKLDLKKKLLV